MKIYVKDGYLCATHSCEVCAHKNVCKFYSKAKDLFKTNEFFAMNKYLESNNSLFAWSENKNCQYYLPFLFDRNLFQFELQKESSYINAYQGWWDLIILFFKDKYYKNHIDYFEKEFIKQRDKSFLKDLTDDKLLNYCVKRSSSSNKIYTVSGNDDSFKYEIPLLDVLEHFNAFNPLK